MFPENVLLSQAGNLLHRPIPLLAVELSVINHDALVDIGKYARPLTVLLDRPRRLLPGIGDVGYNSGNSAAGHAFRNCGHGVPHPAVGRLPFRPDPILAYNFPSRSGPV